MVYKAKAVRFKVLLGYILLFTLAAVSVWFVYSEILKIALPSDRDHDNSKIIRISNTIADLYASEALGRTSILTGAAQDQKRYNKALDSISAELTLIKKDAETGQLPKFDSIQLLIERKRQSTADIILFRRTSGNSNTFTRAITGIYSVKDSIIRKVKPVKMTKRHQWTELVNSLLTPRQLDSLSKLRVSNDSLAIAFEKVLTKLLVKENKLKYELYQKEQTLLQENLIISDQIRALISSLENEFLRNSYLKFSKSQSGISKTVRTIAWAGAVALLILIVFAWVIFSDLTSNQNYRKQLELLNVENEHLLRSKTMLMATVTHDLQTPLGSIVGFSDLMKDTGVNLKQKHYLSAIRESADYILKLVNDLLDYSKLENNRITIDEVSINVKMLIENTCKTLEPAAINKGIKFKWEIDDSLDSNFITDPYRTKQVLTNLISNSIKFTQQGIVKVKAYYVGNTIFVTVTDTGIGIAPEQQEEVFREFTQAHSGIEKKFGGTGLGLTISKRIVELLGGTIKLQSVPGEGSEFTITLPANPGTNVISVANNLMAYADYPSLEGIKILIVDDDTTQLALLRELLTNYGAVVKTESNSSVVESILEREPVDLVLTDIQMPGLDGFGLLDKIRSFTVSKISGLPVIALSGRRDIKEEGYIRKGFTAHHPKPINVKELLTVISSIRAEQVKSGLSLEDDSTSGPLFNLNSLSSFTQNDPMALKMIIETFAGSAIENCKALRTALENSDANKISQIAHKMIPMLRQMEVNSIVSLLEPLEEDSQQTDWIKMEETVSLICSRMKDLIDKIKT